MLARVLAVVCALAAAAHADDWRGLAMVGNDAWNGVLSHPDDDGFTSDLGLALFDVQGRLALGGSLLHRMITARDSKLRCDLGEVFARAAWQAAPALEIEVRIGPTFAGDLGGYWMQSHWHHLTGYGPKNPSELQDLYTGGTKLGGAGGLRLATASTWRGPLRAYGSLDMQLAAGGTGVTFAEAMGGLGAAVHVRGVELGIHGELAGGIYHVDDLRLAVPGGYRRGWQLDERIGVSVAYARYRLAFEYHTNETSSGEPFSIFTLERG